MNDKPIVDTLLDNDWYQFKMAQFFVKMGHRDKGVYSFIDRKKFRLGRLIDINELREQIDNLFSLTLGFRDSEFIHQHGIDEKTIDEINRYVGKTCSPDVCTSGDNLTIQYKGPLPLYVLYETPILAIVNELYSRSVIKYLRTSNDQQKCLESRLDMKLKELRAHPELKFIEFGTRRRYSAVWQEFVVKCLAQELSTKSFLGTSNVLLSQMIGREPKGTMAHQVPMLYAAKAWGNGQPYINDEIKKRIHRSQIKAINDWSTVWGLKDTFWLTDTFTTRWFVNYVKTLTINPRQDSGDPIRIGKLCQKFGAKKIMFSDSLNLPMIMDLNKIFNKDMECFFGWGTDLTNDGQIEPLSVVIKLVSVDGISTAKLGDGVGKEIGQYVDTYKTKVFTL